MKFRDRFNDVPQPDGSPEGAGTENLAELRQGGDELLNAADRAISRALSGDSEAFLVANRQQGGQ